MDAMQRRRTSFNIIILDACRTNPFRGVRMQSGGLAQINIAERHLVVKTRKHHAQGTLVAFATSPKQTAADSSKNQENSPYTTALLNHLRMQNLEIETLFKRVRQEVMISTRGKQRPWNNTDMFGDFYFNPQQ